nr:hypothetical protein [Tanacetum cinerariifolium]
MQVLRKMIQTQMMNQMFSSYTLLLLQCTPPVSTGSTPSMSPCASPISADRHSISAGKCYVSAGRPTGSAGTPISAGKPIGSAGRPVYAGRPSGSAARTPVPAGRILGKLTFNTSS